MQSISITLRPARPGDAREIAGLFMMAWPVEEILEVNALSYEELLDGITAVAAAESTIYSYENTIVAESEGKVIGAMCAYDGADYQRFKKPIVDMLGDGSGFAQLRETEAGEFYLDSIGVLPEFRGMGIATRIFEAQLTRAASLGHRQAGLIVDEDKPEAERLYRRLGFTYLDDKDFFGHRMKHLVKHIH